MRAREVGKGESHSHPYHVDIQVGSCIFLSVFVLNHYMCTYVGSNPCRIIQLLSIAHPIEGKLFQVQGVLEKTALTRGLFEKKAGLWLRFIFFL